MLVVNSTPIQLYIFRYNEHEGKLIRRVQYFAQGLLFLHVKMTKPIIYRDLQYCSTKILLQSFQTLGWQSNVPQTPLTSSPMLGAHLATLRLSMSPPTS